MEEFTEDYSKILLSKEWLVKVDNADSTPYLLKFGVSEEKNTCFILVTDTKTVWAEVLTRNQILRRWCQSNPSLSLTTNDVSFSRLQSLMRDLHTPGGITDANFDIVESCDADLAFELDCDKFKWRWDTYVLGPKTSAGVISKHLILPLISLAHVSFYSADPVSELDEGDLEKTVDKIGRTARRSVDIHVKQTLARPRIATTLQRISSLFGLAPTLPSIKSDAEPPDLEGHLSALRAHISASNDASRPPEATPAGTDDDKIREDVVKTTKRPHSPATVQPNVEAEIVHPPADVDSATESDDGDDGRGPGVASKSKETASQGSQSKESVASYANHVHEPSASHQASRAQDSDSDSPPPTKKTKTKPKDLSDSDSDSDSNTKVRSQGSRGTSTGAPTVVGRGVRQPLKRVGRRF